MSDVKVGAFGDKMNAEQLILDMQSKVGGAQLAVVVYLDEDDYVKTYWTSGSNLKMVGMLHVAQEALIDSGRTEVPPEEDVE